MEFLTSGLVVLQALLLFVLWQIMKENPFIFYENKIIIC